MKYKVGDKVRVKSLDWYNKNKTENKDGKFRVHFKDYSFIEEQKKYCGQEAFITRITDDGLGYFINIDYNNVYRWTDDMLEESKKTSMFDSLMKKFMPYADDTLKMSLNGDVCVLFNGEYVAINQNDELIAYQEEACLDIPLYVILKPFSNIQQGDIIKNGNSYVKVLSKNKDNSLKCLSYSGCTKNKKEIKNFIFGQGLVPCVFNIFSSFTSGIDNKNDGNIMNEMLSNPFLLMLLADKEKNEDSKTSKFLEMFMMKQLMGMGGINLSNNSQIAMSGINNKNDGNIMNGMLSNPLLLMLLTDKEKNEDSKTSKFLEMFMMKQLMGMGGINLSNNSQIATITEKFNSDKNEDKNEEE